MNSRISTKAPYTTEELMLVLELALEIGADGTLKQAETAGHEVSRYIRKSVELRGFPLTDKLRAWNTIGMKLRNFRYILTDGQRGLSSFTPGMVELFAEYFDDRAGLTALCDVIREELDASRLPA